MSWLALQGWNAHLKAAQQDTRLSFRQGLIVHPLSPKTWVMRWCWHSQNSYPQHRPLPSNTF